MTPPGIWLSIREWIQRGWGALTGRRTDNDLQRELAGHLAMAEDELRRQGHTAGDAARLARAASGGHVQAFESLREQRGLPWLDSSWLDVKLALRLLIKNRGLTLVGGLAMTVTIGIAAFVFTAFDMLVWSPLPLENGDRIVAIQVWDREAGRRRDAASRDFERWRTSLQSFDEVGAFEANRRNVIASDGSVELATISAISPAGFRIAGVPPAIGRPIVEADEAPGAAPVIVIGHKVWQQRFAGAHDVIGRQLRLGSEVHTVVGVMPDGFQFPINFQYWVPLRINRDGMLRNTGPEGAVFARLVPDASLATAHAEVAALGVLAPALQEEENQAPPIGARSHTQAIGARVVPYTFAFTGDFESGELGLLWSLSSLMLVVLLLPPCANIAILNYARIITRQQEFAARLALGGSRGRIVWQLFTEALLLTAAAGAVAVMLLNVVLVFAAERMQSMPGGQPFWITFGVSYRTLLFVAGLAVIGATISGLAPALQATARFARIGAGALAARTTPRLGGTWTALVIAQVAFSVGVLPLAAQLAWGTIRTGVVGPGFPAETFASARISREGDSAVESNISRVPVGNRLDALKERLLTEPAISGVAIALQPPGEEPWVFVDIEGLDVPTEVINGQLPGFRARFNQVDAAFFDLYQVPAIAGRRLREEDSGPASAAVVINRNFAETIAPGANALGHRFRYARSPGSEWQHDTDPDRWYEVVGVVGNLPVTTDARVAYHAAASNGIDPGHLQMRLRGDRTGLAERLRDVAAAVDSTLLVDQVRTLAEIYRDHRFGDNLGATTIGAVTLSVLLLSAAGLYALMAFTVAQCRREIGIRSALGAQPGHLLAAVFRRAFWQIGAGSAAGVIAAFLILRYMPIEQIGGLAIPGILPAAAAFMLIVGALAALGPARRGLRIDPTEALRSD